MRTSEHSLKLASLPSRSLTSAQARQQGIIAAIEELRRYREALRAEQVNCLPDTDAWRQRLDARITVSNAIERLLDLASGVRR
jgi:predicted DNA-binding protein (UPF0278 family)